MQPNPALSDSVLPSIKKLGTSFANGDSHAAAPLLNQIGALERPTVILCPALGDIINAPDSSFFAALGNFHLLTSLDIKLAGTISLPCYDLAVQASRGNIDHLKISVINLGIYPGQGLVQVTGRDLLAAPISDRFVLVLKLLAVSSVINTTYDEATMAYKVMAVSSAYMGLFKLSVDKATSFDR